MLRPVNRPARLATRDKLEMVSSHREVDGPSEVVLRGGTQGPLLGVHGWQARSDHPVVLRVRLCP